MNGIKKIFWETIKILESNKILEHVLYRLHKLIYYKKLLLIIVESIKQKKIILV